MSATTHDPRKDLGKTGEDFALSHIQKLGFSLLARNYRTPRGEIDLIAVDGNTLVFIEVKTRLKWSPGPGFHTNSLDWLGSRQQRRQRPIAVAWLADKSRPRTLTRNIRFDAIGVLINDEGELIDLDHAQEVLDGSTRRASRPRSSKSSLRYRP